METQAITLADLREGVGRLRVLTPEGAGVLRAVNVLDDEGDAAVVVVALDNGESWSGDSADLKPESDRQPGRSTLTDEHRGERTVGLALLRAEIFGHVWAIRPEWLSAFAQINMTGELRADAIEAIEAANRRSRVAAPEQTDPVATIGLKGVLTPGVSLFSMLFGDGESGLLNFRDQMRAAVANPDVKSIVIDVDSPGGQVDLIPEIGSEVLAARRVKPVTAVANTMAGSAAYWIASQATDVSVTPSGDVGSIGVFQLHDDISDMDKQMGIKTTLVKAGKFKAERLPFFPLTDDAREAMGNEVNDYYGMFTRAVAQGRRAKVSDVRDGYGEGRMVLAGRAVDAGLADRVETLEAAQARLRASNPSDLSRQAFQAHEADERWAAEHEDLIAEGDEAGEAETAPEGGSTWSREDRLALLDALAG